MTEDVTRHKMWRERRCDVTEDATWQKMPRDWRCHVTENVTWQKMNRDKRYHVTEDATWQKMQRDRRCHVTEDATRQKMPRDRRCHVTEDATWQKMSQQSFSFTSVRLSSSILEFLVFSGVENFLTKWLIRSSSSSSSYICHGDGPPVDPFRSHVSRNRFKVYHNSFCLKDDYCKSKHVELVLYSITVVLTATYSNKVKLAWWWPSQAEGSSQHWNNEV